VRLALIHGFTQTGASWGPVAAALERRGHQVLTPDAPGHGQAAAVRADLWEGAARLAQEVGPSIWVGYSMGGRLCLHVALTRPDVVQALVLVSTTAGIDDPAGRAARREADEELAAGIERDGVPAFVDRWLTGPLWATLPRAAAGIEARLANTPAGLASSLRLAGTGSQEPLWDRIAEIHARSLVITGGLDQKFGPIGDRLAAGLGPGATRVTFPGGGHAVPWEQPDAFVAAVDHWLSQGPAPG
jgi:2-succinyl-6-hydroxy-2,4-cyclohexadiene-1-carboxylate synthase